MCNNGDLARLEFVMKRIKQIEMSIERHGGIEDALSDFEGWNAILLCLFQIGEVLPKLKDLELKEILSSKDAYAFRNIVAHDYDAVKNEYVYDILNKDIPELKSIISSVLNNKQEP